MDIRYGEAYYITNIELVLLLGSENLFGKLNIFINSIFVGLFLTKVLLTGSIPYCNHVLINPAIPWCIAAIN